MARACADEGLGAGRDPDGGRNVADPVKLATKFVSALLEAPEKERERALAMVRGAFPVEPELPEERARRLARERKKRQRDRVTPNVTLERDQSVTGSGTKAGLERDQNGTEDGNVTLERDQSVTLGGRGESLSPVFSEDSPSREQIRESHVTEAPARKSSPDDDVLIPMTLEWEIDDETRAAAAMVGLKGIDAAWASFRAENLDARPRTRRTWLAKFSSQWAPRAKEFERRDAGRGPRLARPTLVQPVPPGGPLWKSGDGT